MPTFRPNLNFRFRPASQIDVVKTKFVQTTKNSKQPHQQSQSIPQFSIAGLKKSSEWDIDDRLSSEQKSCFNQKYRTVAKKKPISSIVSKQKLIQSQQLFYVQRPDDAFNKSSRSIDLSVCQTEETPIISNSVNPVKLADRDWSHPYKLSKLLKTQTVQDGDRIFSQFRCPQPNFGKCKIKQSLDLLVDDLKREEQRMKHNLFNQSRYTASTQKNFSLRNMSSKLKQSKENNSLLKVPRASRINNQTSIVCEDLDETELQILSNSPLHRLQSDLK